MIEDNTDVDPERLDDIYLLLASVRLWTRTHHGTKSQIKRKLYLNDNIMPSIILLPPETTDVRYGYEAKE